MRSLLKRLRCAIGGHELGPWQRTGDSDPVLGKILRRRCACGHIDDLMPIKVVIRKRNWRRFAGGAEAPK